MLKGQLTQTQNITIKQELDSLSLIVMPKSLALLFIIELLGRIEIPELGQNWQLTSIVQLYSYQALF